MRMMNMLRKGQIRGVEKRDSWKQAIFIASLFGVAISAEQENENSRLQHASHISCNTTQQMSFILFSDSSCLDRWDHNRKRGLNVR
jgi:hypothetical protein